jgi:hypothetical protein
MFRERRREGSLRTRSVRDTQPIQAYNKVNDLAKVWLITVPRQKGDATEPAWSRV